MNFLKSEGMISVPHIQAMIEMKKKQELLAMHEFAIWQGTDGKWYTHLPDEEKGRVLRKRNSKLEIEKVVVDYYKQKQENPSIFNVYVAWINEKLYRKEIQYQTKNRYDRIFDLCFRKMGKRKIQSVTESDIEDFILESIATFELTPKGYSNLRTLIYGIFKYAKRKKYVSYSITQIINDLEISSKSFRRVLHDEEELVFSDEEITSINNEILGREYDVIDLGILLLFKTGLRPGELAALKVSDLKHNNHLIHVCRTEVRYDVVGDAGTKSTIDVRDTPKTLAGIRDVIVPQKDVWILDKILEMRTQCTEYLFEKNGKRVQYSSFDRRLRRIENHLDLVPKSLNKIRKTYATILLDNQVADSLVKSQMGHTDVLTTRKYYYKDRRNIEQKMTIINGLKGL